MTMPTPPSTPGGQEPVVAGLRSRPEVIRLWRGEASHIALRVEVPEVWDVVRVETPVTETIQTVKAAALRALYPDAQDIEAFVVKFNGAELRNEEASVSDVGARDGSTFLLTFRRRRPVRS